MLSFLSSWKTQTSTQLAQFQRHCWDSKLPFVCVRNWNERRERNIGTVNISQTTAVMDYSMFGQMSAVIYSGWTRFIFYATILQECKNRRHFNVNKKSTKYFIVVRTIFLHPEYTVITSGLFFHLMSKY